MSDAVGYIGVKPGSYTQFFVPARERGRWLAWGNRIVRTADPSLASDRVALLRDVQAASLMRGPSQEGSAEPILSAEPPAKTGKRRRSA